MADPLSILSGTISIADICIRLINYLRDVQAAAAVIDEDIQSLVSEIEALKGINNSIQTAFGKDLATTPSPPHDFWIQTDKNVRNCLNLVEKLQKLLEGIYGTTGPKVTSVMDSFVKANKKRSKEKELRQCRESLATYIGALQISLQCTNIYINKESHGSTSQSLSDLSQEVQTARAQMFKLQSTVEQAEKTRSRVDNYDLDDLALATIAALGDIRNSVNLAVSTFKLDLSFDESRTPVNSVFNVEPTNKYFDIPQGISSIFTGQGDYLERLRSYLFATTPGNEQQQNRFIVHGIGGSGKTQFCSKFASDNRERYWGVFWIDMSSQERISKTCADIAKLGGNEPTVNAAIHWLSNLDQRWLLIIDNSDDPDIRLDQYFPKGNRGHVLVTTRNPDNKRHGNVGPRFFDFKGLSADDANSLLLRAAGQPTPWDSHLSSAAAAITEALGFLALAITHAGAAISTGLCSLKDYLSFHARSFERIRHKRRLRERHISDGTDPDSIYASFEISYSSIDHKSTEEARDAVQLFKMFAFFHHENIQFDILARSVKNRILEAQHEEAEKEKEKRRTSADGGILWSDWLRKLPFELIQYLLTPRGPPVLPTAIRDAHNTTQFEEDWPQFEDRLRAALKALVQMSLILRNDIKDQESYSMHPLVHKWARERPDQSLTESAMWSEAAATTLSHSLLLPPLPLGDSSGEEAYRAVILPHIQHVLTCQRHINDQISKQKRKRSSWWPWARRPAVWPLTRNRAIMYAKFSIAYAYCGRWSEAEKLQATVKDFLLQMLGMEYANTRRIMLAHASTLRELNRSDEAEQLQVEVLKACEQILKEDHQEILAVKGTLGETYFRQGRYSEAKKLQQDVVSGLERLHNTRKHEEVLSAISNLGLTVMHFHETSDFLAAQKYHIEAAEGMHEVLGPTHLKTLAAKENLAIVASHLEQDLDNALEMIEEVLEERKRRLGKEHPYTLLAMVNKGKIQRAIGDLDEAEKVFRSGLEIADRNLGHDHQGTLLGRYELAQVLLRKEEFEETEHILLSVIELSKGRFSFRGNHHPLRLGSMYELFVCYKVQGKRKECLAIADEAIRGFEIISPVKEHPLSRRMREERIAILEEERKSVKLL